MSTRLRKATLASVAALMLAGFTTTAQGFSGPPSSSGLERQIQLRGKVVCTGCRLEDVQKKTHHSGRLYQVILKQQGRLVMEVAAVSNTRWFNQLLVPHLWVRGAIASVQKLSALETVSREIEISGTITDTNTLNVTEVLVLQDAVDNKLAQKQ